jgi:hypothetical protein
VPQVGVPFTKANPDAPSTAHTACQVLLMDGSARSVSPSIRQSTWALAITPDDGKPLPSDWN